MTKKIFRSILTVAMAVLLAGLLIITSCLYDYFDGVQGDQLRDELNLAAIGTEQLGEAYLEQLNEKTGRLTWVDADGTVLYDTQVDASTMENHADREEIREALETGTGSSTRFSITLVEETLYEAKALSDGTVLRISVSRATAMTLVLGMLSPILAVCALAMILSAVLAHRMAKRVVEPLNELDLDHPLENDTYEELAPLLGRIHAQHQQIRNQLHDLQRKQDEFEQITGNMKEGLILLDSKGTILSINPAARELFQADRNCVGQDFLTVDRAHDVSSAIQKALADGHSQVRTRRNGRDYQLDLSRTQSAGKTQGTVLLAFDVTEQAQAEQRRREFTANVSHELKTPLQSIMGSAELIETGLVKTEDMPRFLGHIRKEASRLVTLIEDIIRLSQLDEGGDLPREAVSLLELAEDARAALQERADAKNVTLSVEGETGTVSGVRRLIFEILYNLCDNAIKYNVEGGSVKVMVTERAGETAVSVQDTGIGIPAEHQDRVFERFYRVDKSHSKQSGGTGLGLSIVKHAVQYHGGSIRLQSEPGKGTTITVSFPKG